MLIFCWGYVASAQDGVEIEIPGVAIGDLEAVVGVSTRVTRRTDLNAFGVLFLMCGLIALRARLSALRLREEIAPPPAATARVSAAPGRP